MLNFVGHHHECGDAGSGDLYVASRLYVLVLLGGKPTKNRPQKHHQVTKEEKPPPELEIGSMSCAGSGCLYSMPRRPRALMAGLPPAANAGGGGN